MDRLVLAKSIATTNGAILLPLGAGVTISGASTAFTPGVVLGLALIGVGGLSLYYGLKQ